MSIIPPGGFVGFAQMTPASRLALGQRTSRGTGRRRRKKGKKARKARKGSSKRRKTTKRKGKMKFGSRAWQKKYKVGKFAKKKRK